MSVEPLQDVGQTPQAPTGHVIGFVDTHDGCDAVTRALIGSGISNERIIVLHGQDGRELLDRMMDGFLWGEEAEQVMREGERELLAKHFVLCVEAKERDEGLQIAKVAESQGGHGFTHFGSVADVRLTA
jgi:hypothetical protein